MSTPTTPTSTPTSVSPLDPIIAELGTSDPVALGTLLFAKQKEQLDLQRRGFQEDPTKTPEENAALKRAFDERIRNLCHFQMQLCFYLRKTGTGPAKAGGKRAKKAPMDQRALDDAIFS